MALALELQARGHHPVLATSNVYQTKIEAAGLEFATLRPDIPDPRTKPDEADPMIRRLMDREKGTEHLFKEVIMPSLRDSYEDLTRVVQGADLLVTHVLPMSGPLVAQKTGVKWASGVLAPLSFFSIYDPSLPPIETPMTGMRKLPPRLLKPIVEIGKKSVLSWVKEVFTLRRQLGLPKGGHPLFEGQHSPSLVLAMFSPVLGAPQPDWPPHAIAKGYCFYDKKDETPTSGRLREFLSKGEAPIVFTLGSSAVFDAGDFFAHSMRAAQNLKRRALLLVGRETALPANLSADILALDYAPFSEVFPRAAAVVHQGGAGTTGQVLRAGVPALTMPYAHDQPDHADRLERLGVARTLRRSDYNTESATRELRALLTQSEYARHAKLIGEKVRAEHGTRDACDALEAMLRA